MQKELNIIPKNIWQTHPKTQKKIQFNLKKNLQQDQTKNIESATKNFSYEECKNMYWNPDEFSLLYGTPLWEKSNDTQRMLLNQLYWCAYYSQIISAEIATILFNQTSAAGLYKIEEFKSVCDTLDLESAQERSHIDAFKTISEATEKALFGSRLFSFPMRSAYDATMIRSPHTKISKLWRKTQLNSFSLLSSNNPFIACQYFSVRGIRTLNGKMVQHRLSQYYTKNPEKDLAPIPSKISFYHFLDESFHFNSSRIISHDILRCLKKPTKIEKFIANLGISGCQKDHYNFSTAINGIFWFDPALFFDTYRILRSKIFSMSHHESIEMLQSCFTEENEAMHLSYDTHQKARNSYIEYVDDLDYINKTNKEMLIMKNNSINKHIHTNKKHLKSFINNINRSSYAKN